MQYILTFSIMIFSLAAAQEEPAADYAYYQGDVYSFKMLSPDSWVVNLEDAYEDGYTVAFYPDSESYFDSEMIIFAWVFKNDSLSFQEFISADSAYYVKDYKGLEFLDTDTIVTPKGDSWIILENTDPGAEQTITLVGYLDVQTEIIIYELNIAEQIHYPEGESKFREALSRFEIAE